MNIKLILAYDGTHYFGWQKTKTGPSVQEALEKALFQILRVPTPVEAASRTDRGVHAKGQVVNFFIHKEIDLGKLLYGINGALPPDIRALHMEKAPENFHPTLHAISKEYRYSIYQNAIVDPHTYPYSWHIHTPLNLEAMRKAAALLIGTHDFAAFTTKPIEDTIRTLLDIQIQTSSMGYIEIHLLGDRFLYKMARRLVGTLVAIGKHRLSLEELASLFFSPNRAAAGMTAPAQGLFLNKVFYDFTK